MNDSIFTPNYNITPDIARNLDSLARQLWLIEHVLLMPKHEAWIRREIQVRRAVGTTRIEGANLDEEAVRSLEGLGAGARITEDELANINALQAYEFIDFLSHQPDIPVDELVIRQLNRYFMNGAADTLTPGTYRKGSNKVGEFTTPAQGDIPALMRSFAMWLREDDGELHPVIKAGLAHIHLVAIHPFWDGNGRTARGLATLILQRSTFGFKKLLSLESQLFEIRDEYFSAIGQALGREFSLGYDATRWLEFFSLTVDIHSSHLADDLTDWQRMMQETYKIFAEKGWNQRLADAFAFAHQAGKITRGDYMEITGVSPVTASRDLAEMVRFGVFVAEGKTRRRIYRPVPLTTEAKDEILEEQLRLLGDQSEEWAEFNQTRPRR
jgi:Fic family protein